MTRTRFRPFAAFAVTAALLAALIPAVPTLGASEGSLSAAARTSASDVLCEPSPAVLTNVLDRMEDDFNRATVNWTVTGGTAEAVTSLDEPPYTVFEGSRSLLLTTEGSASLTMTCKPDALAAPSAIRWLAAAVYAPRDGGQMTLTLSLSGKTDEYRRTVPLTAGRWQTVLFDLTEEALPKKASSLSLAFTSSEEGSRSFLLDCLGGSTDGSAAFSLRYLTPSFRAEGASLSVSETGGLTVALSGGRPYIEAEAPALTDYTGGVGIRVKLKNSSTCGSLTLRYTTLSAADYTEKNAVTVSIPKGEDAVSCLIPIPSSYVGRFRLEFNGEPEGSVEILSVSAVPCYASSSGLGTVSECLVTRDNAAISIKGSLGAEDAAKYAGASLLLYELSAWEDISGLSTARPAVAETTLNGAEFTFSIPLSADHGELFRKYAVAVYYEGALLPVGHPQFVTNPDALASDTQAVTLPSIKGSRPLKGDYLLDGVSCTAVEIRLDQLVSLRETAMTYDVGQVSCSFDADYVSSLDARMTELEACGVKTYLILRLVVPDDLTLKNLLCHPSASGEGYAAFNTVTEEGVGALRAAVDFLARRYGLPSGKTDNLIGFVVGSEVNDAARQYDAGAVTLASFAQTYGNALRVVYNAAKAVSSENEVCLPLGGDWYGALPVSQKSSFDARSTLEALSAYLTEGGNVDFSVSYDIYQSGCAYEIAEPDLSEEADRISAANLEVLTSYLSRHSLLSNGVSRRILFLETEEREPKDENERIRLSADYVYTYLRLKRREFASVRAMIPAHPVDYNGILTYIDTNRFSDVAAFAAELIGGERFDTLLLSGTVAADRYVLENKAVTVIPSAVKGETALFDFARDTAGWYGALNCADLKGGVSLEGKNGLLSVRLASAEPELKRGIAVKLDKPIDLSTAPYLGFTCRPAVLPEGVTELELTVVVTAGNSKQISSLTVKAGVDTTVVVDLTDFPGRASCDGMAVYAKGVNGQDIGEPTLLLGPIRAMSESFGGNELDQVIRPPIEEQDDRPAVALRTVITIAAVGSAALLLEAVRILLRHREGRKEDD